MPAQALNKKLFDWRFPFCTGVVSIVIVGALAFSNGYDIDEVLYILLVAPFVALVMLATAAFKRSPTVFCMLVVYCVTTWFVFKKSDDTRTSGRWLLESATYKAELLRQPEETPGELKHMEWDGGVGLVAIRLFTSCTTRMML